MLDVTARPEQDDDRADERRGGEDGVLERSEREHPRDRVLSAKAGAAERPVVDREAARRVRGREDAEAGDDRAHRQSQREHRPAVNAGDGAHGEHVPEIGRHLAGEADREPDRHDVLDRVYQPAIARHVGETDRRRRCERSGADQDEDVAPLEAERGPDRLRPSPPARHDRSSRSHGGVELPLARPALHAQKLKQPLEHGRLLTL